MAAHSVECPECESSLTLPAGKAIPPGAKAKCPKCGIQISLTPTAEPKVTPKVTPSAKAPAPAAANPFTFDDASAKPKPSAAAPRQARRSRRKQVASRTKAPWLVGGGVILVVVVAVIIVLAKSGNKNDERPMVADNTKLNTSKEKETPTPEKEITKANEPAPKAKVPAPKTKQVAPKKNPPKVEPDLTKTDPEPKNPVPVPEPKKEPPAMDGQAAEVEAIAREDDGHPLRGRWAYERSELNGSAEMVDDENTAWVEITEERLVHYSQRGGSFRGHRVRIKIDGRKGTIDFIDLKYDNPIDPETPGVDWGLGIFERDGDKLKICYTPAKEKADRPDKFETKEGTQRQLWVLRRLPASKPEPRQLVASADPFQNDPNLVLVPDGLKPGGAVPAETVTQGMDVLLKELVEGGSCAAFTPDGSRVAVGYMYEGIRVFDSQTGQMVGNYRFSPIAAVHTVSFSADGKNLVAGAGEGAFGVFENVFDKPMGYGVNVPYSSGVIAASPNHRYKLLGGRDGKVRVFEGKFQQRRSLEGHKNWVSAIAVSPDGKTVASGDEVGHIIFWDFATGKLQFDVQSPHKNVRSLAFSPDGKTLISGGAGKVAVAVWDPTTGKPTKQLDNLPGTVLSVSFARNGEFAIGAAAKGVFVWKTSDWSVAFQQESKPTNPTLAAAMSPGGKRIVSVGMGMCCRLMAIEGK